MTKRKRAYLNYLRSEHWKTLRLKAFKRDGFRCVRCGSSRNLHGHHKRYRKFLHGCSVGDIETLCQKCHEKHHRQEAQERKRNRKPKISDKHLAYVLLAFDADP